MTTRAMRHTTRSTSVLERGRVSLGQAVRPFARRFGWVALYFAAVFIVGTVGYVVIEGWGWFEAFYMAVTTASSVGFMEVRPLSPGGRTFTLVIVALGVTGLGLWWGLTTALIVELDLLGHLRRRRMQRAIEELENHFIVCGIGRMGRVVIGEMARSRTPFVAIDRDASRVAALAHEYPGVLTIADDATKEHTLEEARIGSARGLAACLSDDADNIMLCLTARGLRRDLTIVARAYDEETLDKLRRAGADHTVSPNVTGGVRMASTLIRPSVVSFLDVTTGEPGIELRLEEASIPAGSSLAGLSLADARIPQRTGLVVLAVRRGPGELLYNPGPETRLAAGDVMLVLGKQDQVTALRGYVEA